MNQIFAQFRSGIKAYSLPHTSPTQDNLAIAFNLMLITLGAIALLIVVIAGLQYVTSQSNPDTIAEAKRRIIYTMVGLVIAASSVIIAEALTGRL